MSTNPTAVLCLGLRISEKKLYEEKVMDLCSCPSDNKGTGKFCANCGESRKQKELFPIGEYTMYEGYPDEFLWGFDPEDYVFNLPDNQGAYPVFLADGFAFIGESVKLRSRGANVQERVDNSLLRMLKGGSLLDTVLAQQLKACMSPIKLWDDKNFGVWHLLVWS